MAPKVLFVLSSHGKMDPTDKPTGWYLPEAAHPWEELKDHAEIVWASPAGGHAPLDPSSVEAFKDDKICKAFQSDKAFANTENTEKLSTFQGRADEFAALFYVGGHGPMYDLAHNEISHAVIREFADKGKIIAAVCHGPAALAYAKLSNGEYLVKDAEVTGFSNSEEDAVGLSQYMPFMLENALKENGGQYKKADKDWGPYVAKARGGKLITGQNPSSATPIGQALKEAIGA